jgi:hypothetical protein
VIFSFEKTEGMLGTGVREQRRDLFEIFGSHSVVKRIWLAMMMSGGGWMGDCRDRSPVRAVEGGGGGGWTWMQMNRGRWLGMSLSNRLWLCPLWWRGRSGVNKSQFLEVDRKELSDEDGTARAGRGRDATKWNTMRLRRDQDDG